MIRVPLGITRESIIRPSAVSMGVLSGMMSSSLAYQKNVLTDFFFYIASSGKPYCAEYIFHGWMEPYRFVCDGVEERQTRHQFIPCRIGVGELST